MTWLAIIGILLTAGADSTEPKEPAGFETIVLRTGQVLRGEVLKDKPDSLVIDLGIDVLQVSKSAIASRSKEAALPEPSSSRERVIGESRHLYATVELPTTTVERIVERFGRAVVKVKTPNGLGSGFLIDRAGHCITNCHVIEQETRIVVDVFQKTNGGPVERSIPDVEIVAINPFFDLALLRVPLPEGGEFEHVYLGFAEDMVEGETVFAVGNPLDLSGSVTRGVISSRNRNVNGQLYIQTDAPINPGNSGGPLFNLRGQVIGVTNMRSGLGESLGFAIPVQYVKDFLQNREAFAYNKDNPNAGYRYLDPPRRRVFSPPKKP